jgi:prepilin-type processing-associated H-X9-DG protein
LINCSNNNELYSFHPGGVNALFTDGSVHFLKESMDPRIVVSLITRAGGEIVSADQAEVMIMIHRVIFVLAIWPTLTAIAAGEEPRTATRNVVLVTSDGLRWQDVFRGADPALLNQPDGGVTDVAAIRREYWRETPEARREALMPFLWTVVARRGQLYGNADKASPAKVANGMNLSYPGYNEMFTGSPDPRIDSNDKRPNPNVTVFEWLNRRPGYRGKVSAVGSWDGYPFILNAERSGLFINAGCVPFDSPTPTECQVLLNRLIAQSTQTWDDHREDAFTFQIALEHLRHDAPRVFYIGLNDTDEHAHDGRYDRYLRAAHTADANLRRLWEELQSRPQYRDTTTMIITTDHGRGNAPVEWKSHGAKVKGSEATWIGVIGPDTPALGERIGTALVTEGQVAATIAALLGEDYVAETPAAAPPIAEAIRPAGGRAAVPAEPLSRHRLRLMRHP